MQSFSTADARHKFEIDGVEYALDALSPDDIEQLEDVLNTPAEQRFVTTRDFMYAHADADAKKAIGSLGIKQMTLLFRQWIGLEDEPGEPVGSSDVP
jgi:hypothetical protein